MGFNLNTRSTSNLRGSKETKLEDKEKNFIIVEILKRILLPISALLLILIA